jgi:hypothetical protein
MGPPLWSRSLLGATYAHESERRRCALLVETVPQAQGAMLLGGCAGFFNALCPQPEVFFLGNGNCVWITEILGSNAIGFLGKEAR